MYLTEYFILLAFSQQQAQGGGYYAPPGSTGRSGSGPVFADDDQDGEISFK